MNYRQATTEQLYTIAYHETCSQIEKLQALTELNRRDGQAHGIQQQRITRKRNG